MIDHNFDPYKNTDLTTELNNFQANTVEQATSAENRNERLQRPKYRSKIFGTRSSSTDSKRVPSWGPRAVPDFAYGHQVCTYHLSL